MKLAPISALLLISALPAGAVNVLVNGSFESTTTAIVPTTGTTLGQTSAFEGLTGWTHVSDTGGKLANGGTGPTDPGPYYAGNGSTIPNRFPTNGNTFALFDGGTWTLTQAITVAGPGTIIVSYDLIRLHATGTGGQNFRFELFDGADASAPELYDITTSVAAQTQETWVTITSGPTPLNNTGTQLFVRITGTDNGTGSLGGVDKLIVDYVPEPSSSALLGLAGAALLLRRRR